MTSLHYDQGIWFIYDGECPLCKSAAQALRIKKEHGRLNLVDARSNVHPHLIEQINRRGFDLDEGMVIYKNGHFYHGKDALRFMAKYSDTQGLFNLANKTFFWSDTLARLLYPWMRGIRNALLRRRHVSPIDNLALQQQPTFKSIFASDWDNLPPVLVKHYSNRPYTEDRKTFEGTMNIHCSGPIKYLAPLFWLMGGIPPHSEQGVPVTVHFDSEKQSKAFVFNRTFHFKLRKPYSFKSRMLPISKNEVIEVMRFGLGWRMKCVWQDGRVKLLHNGYALKWFGHLIPLPLTHLLGSGNAEEVAVSENAFEMSVKITHPFWGTFYDYNGQFQLKEDS